MSPRKGKAIPTAVPGSKTLQIILGGSLPKSVKTGSLEKLYEADSHG
jgi:hypothetical protein